MSLTQLETVILCGGQGTRLREETEYKPKPMVEVGGRPILWHIMKIYAHYGVDAFVLCLGYKGDVIRDYFINYRNRAHDLEVNLASGVVRTLGSGDDHVNWRVVLAETGLLSQTGTRMRLALKQVKGETFLATYGDGVADVDIGQLVDHHKKMGKLATVTAVHPSSRFGELSISGNTVRNFNEKPQVDGSWINGGYFVFEKAAFNHLPAGADVPLETGLLEKLAAMGQLAVYCHHGFWQCMDTYRESQLLNALWQSGQVPWRVWE